MHQDKTNTGLNRYPNIFKACQDIMGIEDLNILSYGCSSGEELATLSMYFNRSRIHGVEINDEMRERSRLVTKNAKHITLSKDLPNDKYDLIFCMSVLCRWPDTETVNNCGDIYGFDKFDYAISQLTNHLKINGILVIYNSNFRMMDSTFYKNYECVCESESSGFVHKFDINNNKISSDYKECIFRKISDPS